MNGPDQSWASKVRHVFLDVPRLVVGDDDGTHVHRKRLAVTPHRKQRRPSRLSHQGITEVDVHRQQQARPVNEFSHGQVSWHSNGHRSRQQCGAGQVAGAPRARPTIARSRRGSRRLWRRLRGTRVAEVVTSNNVSARCSCPWSNASTASRSKPQARQPDSARKRSRRRLGPWLQEQLQMAALAPQFLAHPLAPS